MLITSALEEPLMTTTMAMTRYVHALVRDSIKTVGLRTRGQQIGALGSVIDAAFGLFNSRHDVDCAVRDAWRS